MTIMLIQESCALHEWPMYDELHICVLTIGSVSWRLAARAAAMPESWSDSQPASRPRPRAAGRSVTSDPPWDAFAIAPCARRPPSVCSYMRSCWKQTGAWAQQKQMQAVLSVPAKRC